MNLRSLRTLALVTLSLLTLAATASHAALITVTGPTTNSEFGTLDPTPIPTGVQFNGSVYKDCGPCTLTIDFMVSSDVGSTAQLNYGFFSEDGGQDGSWTMSNGAGLIYASGGPRGGNESGMVIINTGLFRFSLVAGSGGQNYADMFEESGQRLAFTVPTGGAVPEPGTWLLVASAGGLAVFKYRRSGGRPVQL